MNIDRPDIRAIRAEDRAAILTHLGIAQTQILATGSEAEVYALDDSTVVKIYAGSNRFEYVKTLRHFYEHLDTNSVPFKLPKIIDILQQPHSIAVIEVRLPGTPLDDLLPALHGAALERAQHVYLDTIFQLQHVRLQIQPQTYLLFDAHGHSSTANQSFEQWYAQLLESALDRVSPFFSSYDSQFPSKIKALIEAIRTLPPAPLALIHGDFFPGNLLVEPPSMNVQAVIDFGVSTMFGNYLLDVAGAFGYYRLHDPQRKHIRAAMLPKVLDRIPSEQHHQFFQFLLATAITTSDMYTPDPDPREDGHFQWALEIASELTYWQQALG